MTRRDNKNLIHEESKRIEQLNEEEIDEEELFFDFGNDLKRLLKESNQKKGNPISKKIVENIDYWLKS